MYKRKTSIEAYHKIKASGALEGMRWLVYEHLYLNGPLTTRQIFNGLDGKIRDIGNVAARISQLCSNGTAQIVGEAKCETSKKNVYLWDVTERDEPIILDKPETHKCKVCNGTGVIKTVQSRLF